MSSVPSEALDTYKDIISKFQSPNNRAGVPLRQLLKNDVTFAILDVCEPRQSIFFCKSLGMAMARTGDLRSNMVGAVKQSLCFHQSYNSKSYISARMERNF